MRRFVALLLCTSLAFGQATPPSNASQNSNNVPSGWGYSANVTVYIDSAVFPQGSPDANAVERGFNDNATAYNNQGVSYTFTYFNGDNGVPSMSANSVWVTDASFSDPNQYGNNSYSYYFSGPTGNDVVTTSTISLDLSKLNSDDAVQFAVSHEDSHDYYLGDCYQGCGNDSIMSYSIDENNPPFFGPTDTDINTSYDFGGGGGWDPWTEW